MCLSVGSRWRAVLHFYWVYTRCLAFCRECSLILLHPSGVKYYLCVTAGKLSINSLPGVTTFLGFRLSCWRKGTLIKWLLDNRTSFPFSSTHCLGMSQPVPSPNPWFHSYHSQAIREGENKKRVQGRWPQSCRYHVCSQPAGHIYFHGSGGFSPRWGCLQTCCLVRACFVVVAQLLSRVWLSATPWTIAQSPLSTGFSEARILEWVAISFSKGSSWPRDWIHVSCLAGGFFIIELLEKLETLLPGWLLPAFSHGGERARSGFFLL